MNFFKKEEEDLLSHAYREILRCNRCGFCQGPCPIYRVTGLEMSVARGHHALLREMIEGRLKLTREAGEVIFNCLLCRGCVPPCMPAVATDEVLIEARQAYVARFGLPFIRRWIIRGLLPRPGLLQGLTGILARARPGQLLRAARRFLPEKHRLSLLHASYLAEKLAGQPLRKRIEAQPFLNPGQGQKRIAYFLGCGFNYLLPGVAESTLVVLTSAGWDVALMDNFCCGLPAYAHGDLETARALARKNLDKLAALAIEEVVTDCASCSSFLKEYERLLASDSRYGQAAARFASQVKDINQLLAHQVDKLRVKSLGVESSRPPLVPSTFNSQPSTHKLKVTFHDPCHLVRYQGIREEPREILKQLPGLDFVEMAEADWCCGAAGTYFLDRPQESLAVLDRKMNNLEESGAQILATSCPACILQLAAGVEARGLKVEVLHLTQLLALWTGEKNLDPGGGIELL